MKKFPPRSLPGLTVSAALIISLLAACSTMPPPTPAYDLKSISGKWVGTIDSQQYGRVFVELVIKPEGAWQMITMKALWIGRHVFTGRVYIEDDIYEVVTDVPELCGRLTLYSTKEGRTLKFKGAGGSTQGILQITYK